ncbi:S-adenosyl-L-methionine-dependent methyltransferase [Lipomyces tetrasporus]|uniref:S-adenosyl-L-methionine-dependent methyltransferase n=1 Tax=Lipomyces tetrasporus TaxID=54092 RepID=A0AAD7VTP3_9ASCO|nr:S-adenosyl-L-methionine-dependent methyltransferase [Lipomyces tetrasporus]KAJ8102307.1 S-adenosyl-L-methionine-dependent methyltransferase [Lipomyces tetrasporus]
MNLYLDASKFIKPKTSFAKSSASNFSDLQSAIQTSLPSLKSDPKRIYALLRSTIRYKEIIDDVLNQAELLKHEKISYSLAIVLVHDFLISKTGITAGKGPLKDAILRHKTRLKGEFTKVKIKRGIRDLAEFNSSSSDRTIRWIRVNKILSSSLPASLPFTETSEFPPPPGTIFTDKYIPHLYAVANSHTRKLTSTQAYQRGELIVQDRASCFPAHILSPEPGEIVVDACAAPGNKTSHLAAIMGNIGKVIAYELNSDRAKVLQRMVKRAGASIVRVENRDFTDGTPEEWQEVTKVLCDPSCSGSGIFRKEGFVVAASGDETEEHEENGEDTSGDALKKRLLHLSIFQTKIMKHALTKFPKATRVVYSTCSIYSEENEDVVRNLLTDPEIAKLGWRAMTRDNVIPTWHRRGLTERFEGMRGQQSPEEIADGCVRADPIVDGGIGFFVAGLERDDAHSHKRVADGDHDADEWNGFDDAVDSILIETARKKRNKRRKRNVKGV